MLLKFPTTKTRFTFSAPAAQLIAAEMSQAHEQRALFYLKGLGRFFIFIPTSLPCAGRKKTTNINVKTPLDFCELSRFAHLITARGYRKIG